MTEIGMRYKMQEWEQALQRIAELQEELTPLRQRVDLLEGSLRKKDRRIAELEADRDRLCEVVKRNPCRVALEKLVDLLDKDYRVQLNDHQLIAELKAARKALADTEHEVRKP